MNVSTSIDAIMDRQAVLKVAERCVAYLKERYGIKRAIVFGSAREGKPWHEGSDLDLAVEGLAPEYFFRAYSELHELLPPGFMLDLVSLEDAPLELRARVLGEVKMAEDPMSAVKGLVTDEIRTLERLVGQMDQLLVTRADPPTWIELHAMASLLHGFYTGVESIFERIVIHLGEGMPKGEFWHRDLLEQVAVEYKKLRPAVIDEQLQTTLKSYLDFRHFFRHAYGVNLEWIKLRPLAEGLKKTFDTLQRQLIEFFDKIQTKMDDGR